MKNIKNSETDPTLTCVIIAGPLTSANIAPLITFCKSTLSFHIIISTWNSENSEYIESLRTLQNLSVLTQPVPIIRNASNYQIKAVSHALDYATSRGHKYGLRLRTDFLCNDLEKLLFLLLSEFLKHPINFLCFHRNTPPFSRPYCTDHVIFGKVEELGRYFSGEQSCNDHRPPEYFLQENYFLGEITSYKQVVDKCDFFIERIWQEDIRFFYTKPEYMIQGEMLKIYLTKHGRY
jgi:hypothetical protein